MSTIEEPALETVAFDVAVDIEAQPAIVMTAFWRLETWPDHSPHVLRIEIHFEDENTQVLSMTVKTRDRQDTFKSVRVKRDGEIFYFQPSPPPVLRQHYGWWLIKPSRAGTMLISRHVATIDLASAGRYLAETGGGKSLTQPQTVAKIVELIRNNSLQTMQGQRRRLQMQQGIES